MAESNFEKVFPKVSDKIPVTERSVRSRANQECQREGYLAALKWIKNTYHLDEELLMLIEQEIEAVEKEEK